MAKMAYYTPLREVEYNGMNEVVETKFVNRLKRKKVRI
jgi:hypothetical protein